MKPITIDSIQSDQIQSFLTNLKMKKSFDPIRLINDGMKPEKIGE
jgi:hypothetical protein